MQSLQFSQKEIGIIDRLLCYPFEISTLHQLIYNPTDPITGEILRDNNGLFLIDSLVDILRYSSKIHTTSASAYFNHKINARHVIKAGVIVDAFNTNFIDSLYNADATYDDFSLASSD